MITKRSKKKPLVNFVKLNYLSDEENTVLTLTIDATSNAVGAFLQQNINRENTPISFFSLKLNSSRMKYSKSSTSRHLFIYPTFLEWREFMVYTDRSKLDKY